MRDAVSASISNAQSAAASIASIADAQVKGFGAPPALTKTRHGQSLRRPVMVPNEVSLGGSWPDPTKRRTGLCNCHLRSGRRGLKRPPDRGTAGFVEGALEPHPATGVGARCSTQHWKLLGAS